MFIVNDERFTILMKYKQQIELFGFITLYYNQLDVSEDFNR